MNKKDTYFGISERRVLLRTMDIISVFGLLYLTHQVFNYTYFEAILNNWKRAAVLALYLTVFGSIFEIYDLPKASRADTTAKNVILTVSITVLLYLLTPLYSPELPANRLQIVFFYLAIIVAITLWRLVYLNFISTPRFHKRVLLVANAKDMEFAIETLQKSDPSYKVTAVLNTVANGWIAPKEIQVITIDTMVSEVQKMNISEIIVASRTNDGITIELNRALLKLLEKGIPIYSYSMIYEELTHRIPVKHVEKDFYNYFPFSRSNQNKLYLFFSRTMDLVLSALGLLLGLLLLPIVLLGNLIANRGKLLYSQTRVGQNGKLFKLYKLRSMIENAEENGAQFSYKGDVRITKFGRFLRRSRFDEFPQFFNVLKGDMSIIGPRPERPEFVSVLNETIPFYDVRHIIKPGITGWAQVQAKYGENEEDSLEKLQYDLYYIKHRGVFLDITIITKTLSTIVFFRGQ